MSTWQPIETSPRDGTEFQARIPDHGEDNVIAWFDGVTEGENGPCGSWIFTREQEPPACWSDGYWWAENKNGQQSVTPTHWKPIAMMEARK